MKRIISSVKGFTVIEMMVAIIIAGLLTASIFSFLLVHIKSYKTTEDMVNLQYDGQIVLNQISNIAMESKGIYRISLINDASFLEEIELNSITNKISIDNEDEYIVFMSDSETIIEYHIFKFKGNNTLEYSLSKNADLSFPENYGVIGKNIKSFNLTPSKSNLSADSGGESFKASNGIEIELELEKDGSLLTVNTQAKYRNKI